MIEPPLFLNSEAGGLVALFSGGMADVRETTLGVGISKAQSHGRL